MVRSRDVTSHNSREYFREWLRESLRSGNSHSLPLPIVTPLGGYKSIPFGSKSKKFPRQKSIFLPKTLRSSLTPRFHEFEKALKNYRQVALTIKWNEWAEVKHYLKDDMLPDTNPLTWREKWVVEMGPVLKTYFIEKDPDRALFWYLPKVATTCKGSIGALLSASFCERIQKLKVVPWKH